jgi:hypothetical protein
MLHEKEKGRGDLWMKTGGMPRGIRRRINAGFPAETQRRRVF